ncbi:MAG: aldehyde dehydrogenase family protein, partial [Flavobacteriaceae bacterium]
MKKIKNLVAGIWEECDDYFTFLERKFFIANLEQAKQSVEAAHNAFLCYGNSSNKERAEFLSQIQKELEQQKSEILTVYQDESKLPEGRAEGEFARTLNQIQSFVDLLLEGQYVQAKLQQIEGGAKIRKMLQPIGPIAVFGASNFPVGDAIEIKLSSDIDYSTITENSFQILDEDGNPVPGTISFTSSGVRFTPDELSPNTRYQVSLTSD